MDTPASTQAASDLSATSHLANLIQHPADGIHERSLFVLIVPDREASTNAEAPRSTSHLPVRKPSPPRPPVITCVPRMLDGCVSSRTTTLPRFDPPCKHRNARTTPSSSMRKH
eukprot:scaffold329647_cov95-Tisochrysis_lutea.AAC.2